MSELSGVENLTSSSFLNSAVEFASGNLNFWTQRQDVFNKLVVFFYAVGNCSVVPESRAGRTSWPMQVARVSYEK